MKRFGYFFYALAATALLLLAGNSPARATEAETIHWYASLDEGYKQAQLQNKKILVDLVTDWCAYCPLMDQQVYQRLDITRYVNAKFIAVRLNAETLDTLIYQNHKFPYLPGVRTNELAYKLLDGKLEYPATVFLTQKGDVLQAVHGYIPADTMTKVLQYFGEDFYKTNDWDIFMNRY